ncbi:hypothetical protein B0H15DRAFT_865493 [Mycena belliarum]|uniref:Uncharacterized protein n=1 Tax=Mycena belliarum TaxID=1033014 RepID=A0AAD6TRV9_9AGAR|nr:hypothetical protein B0H15DRAFT_865493 [Mycena belliae]
MFFRRDSVANEQEKRVTSSRLQDRTGVRKARGPARQSDTAARAAGSHTRLQTASRPRNLDRTGALLSILSALVPRSMACAMSGASESALAIARGWGGLARSRALGAACAFFSAVWASSTRAGSAPFVRNAQSSSTRGALYVRPTTAERRQGPAAIFDAVHNVPTSTLTLRTTTPTPTATCTKSDAAHSDPFNLSRPPLSPPSSPAGGIGPHFRCTPRTSYHCAVTSDLACTSDYILLTNGLNRWLPVHRDATPGEYRIPAQAGIALADLMPRSRRTGSPCDLIF